ncbi:uncharacterized protein LOC141588767 [Silene latifolia]|uniref:uncharacterized protein LOC141588767 n=1 Tax=Silene latifolia TaxID=37657 RepID=UPI003D7783D7
MAHALPLSHLMEVEVVAVLPPKVAVPDLFMEMKITPQRPALSLMTWNVQGAGSAALMSMLRELIRINKPRVLALVETHISGETAQRVCDRITFGGRTRVKADGKFNAIWYYLVIYASPDLAKKEELWRDLEDFAATHNRLWMAMGDFNDTRFLQERNGTGDTMRRRCVMFSSWSENNDWIDLNYTGLDFTWARGHTAATRKWARLDRAIWNSNWRVTFSEGALRNLVQNQSDHCPILVNTNGFAPIPQIIKPFSFQAAWMCHEKFSEFVKSNWRND